ncbi:MAG: LysM peptidoglycan-binding domain-containing protein [Candidatus Marinimicrobia bacterium]|nr:LysM peptidoglycan-binding domain-containing protein [Candidatus Neomarinimicrobiota bacterium]
MKNKKPSIARLLLLLFLFVLSIDAKTLKQTNVKDTLDSQDELASENSLELFELLFAEAKNFYVEALIGNHNQDTTEVKYCLDRTIEIIAEISKLDSMTILQREDFRRFYERLNSDFNNEFAWVNGDDGSYLATQVKEGLSASLADTIDLGGDDKLIILEDKEGSLPLVTSPKIERIINYYAKTQKNNFQEWLNNANYYEETVRPILEKENLPQELFYLALIESGFKTSAYSHAHAAGPWQFIASTGAYYGLKRTWWVDERRDVVKASIAAAQYLSDLHDYFDDWYLAMAAYNCGKLNVLRAIRREGTRDFWKLKTLPKETRNYIPSFMAGLNIVRDPEKYGFEKPNETKWEFDEVLLQGSYELESLAKMCGTTAQVLKDYNPELRRWVTPPDAEEYILRVPKSKGPALAARIKEIPAGQQMVQEFVNHRVRSGQNLNYIAKKYGTSVSAIVSANNIRNINQLKIGQTLKIPSSTYYTAQYIDNKSTSGTHLVKKGETLYDIATRYGVSLNDLRSVNNLYGKRFIYPGQKLYIPGLAAKPENTKTETGEKGQKIVHVVQRGETLSQIADKYAVSLSKVRYWNNIYGTKFIYPGQKVTIYQ